jgi:anaerobic magnesium-protoporphyrin IX monomethyl ester cyclase
MKILLINPPFTNYAGGVKGYGGKTAPLNLAYIASYLIEKGYNVKILDAEVHEMPYDKICKTVKLIDPDIIGFTSPTPAQEQVEELSALFKKINPKVKILAGGPHPTALPKRTLKESVIDYICIGEGEQTTYELLKELEKKNPNLSKVDGLAYRNNNNKIIKNKPRALIKDLDTLPFPARHLLPKKLYFLPPTKRISNKNSTTAISSRGCPFECTYCVSAVIWGRGVRFRSAKNVVDEMEDCINKYNIGEFNFHDDLFTVNEKRVLDICNDIKKRNLDVDWTCQARVDRLSMKMLHAMKKAGCGKISFGFESGSNKILKLMKKHSTPQQAIKAVKMVKKVGIRSAGSFMLGNLGETKKTMRQTINLAKKLNTDTATFFQTSPYIGTELYDIAIKKGYLHKNVKWKDYALLSKNPPALELPGLKSCEVKKTIKKAYLEYYLRPKYIFNKIKTLKNTRDIVNLYNGMKILKGYK